MPCSKRHAPLGLGAESVVGDGLVFGEFRPHIFQASDFWMAPRSAGRPTAGDGASIGPMIFFIGHRVRGLGGHRLWSPITVRKHIPQDEIKTKSVEITWQGKRKKTERGIGPAGGPLERHHCSTMPKVLALQSHDGTRARADANRFEDCIPYMERLPWSRIGTHE